jgi:PAS domain S-box-containing protein
MSAARSSRGRNASPGVFPENAHGNPEEPLMRIFNRFNDLRIRFKLLIIYSAVFVFSLAVVSLIIHSFVRKTLETNIESELLNTNITIRNMVKTAADVSIKNHLRAVAEKNREIVTYFHDQFIRGILDESTAKSRYQEVLLSQTIGNTGYIYCVNSNGVIEIHPKKGLPGADLSGFEFILDQIHRKNGYLEYDWKNPEEQESRPKALYMTYFEPWDWIISVSSYRSEFDELVNVNDFEDQILSLRFGKTGYAYVMDTRGTLIIHPVLKGKNLLQTGDVDGRRYFEDICRRRNGKIAYAWANPGESFPREKLVLFNDIPEFEWIVASSCYLEEFEAPLTTVTHIFVITVLLTLVLFPPLTFLISASITTPLRELMRHFASGARGDISVRMNLSSQDEVGQLSRYFNLFMDRLQAYRTDLENEISDREKAEATIRESEAKYRELVQNANSIILRMDTCGRITFFNEFAQIFFGYDEAEVIGKNVVGTIVSENKWGTELPGKIPDVIGGPEEGYRYHGTENILRNGQTVWISWTRKAVHHSSGNVIEYLCIGNDITDAVQTQREMYRLRKYLQAIIDSMPSIIVGVDQDLCVSFWNQEAERAQGVPRKQALGQRPDALFPRLRDQMSVVNRAMAEKSIKKLEKVPDWVDQDLRYFDIVIYPIHVQGLVGAVIRLDDVTARIRMEDMMVQTEKMLSIGGLAAGMAHEINNPLAGMLQSAQNILRRISPELSANRQAAEECGVTLEGVRNYLAQRGIIRFIEAIRESGERASRTVSDMLNFSRKSSSQKSFVCLAELLDRTVALAARDYDLKKKYDFRNIEIVREYTHELPPVLCTPPQIEQVILNLLRNAAQAMTGSMPANKPPRITFRLYQEGNFACIEVIDNGPGMDENTRKRVFEPFFTTKDVGIGTGLGLSVSYFIISSNHGGTLSVASCPGDGARFLIRLPIGI